jgi:hypothetical protein
MYDVKVKNGREYTLPGVASSNVVVQTLVATVIFSA